MEEYPDYVYENIRHAISYSLPYGDLFESNSLLYNITYGLKEVTNIVIEKMNYYLNLFAMTEFIDQLETINCSVLSSGQKQRIKIIRLILIDKPIWVLDEVTSNIDDSMELIILHEIKRIQQEKQKSIICITHNKDLLSISDFKMHIENYKISLERV